MNLTKRPGGSYVLYMLHNGLQVVWNKMTEQHQILAVMIQLVLYKVQWLKKLPQYLLVFERFLWYGILI